MPLNRRVLFPAFVILALVLVPSCGNRGDRTGAGDEGQSVSTASDINFVGGGTQAPDTSSRVTPYHSPTLSSPPPPTTLTWVTNIDQAVSLSHQDRRMKVMAWFRNDDCGDCNRIEAEVFNDPRVIAVSRDWLFVKVDTERNPDRAEYYLQTGTPPALVAIDQRGNGYRSTFEAVTVEQMVTILTTWR